MNACLIASCCTGNHSRGRIARIANYHTALALEAEYRRLCGVAGVRPQEFTNVEIYGA